MEGECPGCHYSVSCISGLLLTHHCLLAAMEPPEEAETNSSLQPSRYYSFLIILGYVTIIM